MDLHQAFKKYVQKYYEGFGYENVAKAAPGGKFNFDHTTLDNLHKSYKKGSGAKSLEDLEEDLEGEDEDNMDEEEMEMEMEDDGSTY